MHNTKVTEVIGIIYPFLGKGKVFIGTKKLEDGFEIHCGIKGLEVRKKFKGNIPSNLESKCCSDVLEWFDFNADTIEEFFNKNKYFVYTEYQYEYTGKEEEIQTPNTEPYFIDLAKYFKVIEGDRFKIKYLKNGIEIHKDDTSLFVGDFSKKE